MKRNLLLPDPALALVVCAVCLGASISRLIVRELIGVEVTGPLPLVVILLGYVLLESVRHARPLAGAVAGALATLALVTPMFVEELLFSWNRKPDLGVLLGYALAIAAAAVAGLALSAAALLVRRLLRLRRRESVAETSSPRGLAAVILAIVAMMLVLFETAGWVCQSPFAAYFGRFLVDWHGWDVFYRYDRLLLVVIAGVLAYAVLRRLRFARAAWVAYLVGGLGVTLTRAVFLHLTARLWPEPSLGHITSPGNGYQYVNLTPVAPSVPFDALVRVNTVELAVRAVVCAVGLFLLLRAGQRRPATGPSQRG